MDSETSQYTTTSGLNSLMITREHDITVITLNSPESINALSEEMLQELHTSLKDIAQDPDVKVVILRSSGKHFSAGHNLKEMTARRTDKDGGKAYFQKLFDTCSSVMKAITRLPQPVIAEVRGIATAAGCQLVASCDLAVASEDAKFATSGVNVGLFCTTPMVALTRNISQKQAMEMLLLGDFLPASQVASIGLINRVVEDNKLSEETMAMARKIADKSPAAIKLGKQAFYKQMEMSLEEAYDYASRVMADNMMCRDTKAGIQAFIDKKPMPEWTGE